MIAVRLNRLGVHLGFIALFAVLGGALRGFNLLLMVAGLLVGILVIQWRLSRRIVESVDVQRKTLADTFAGQTIRFQYTVENLSRWVPAWLVIVRDRIQVTDSGSKRKPLEGQCGIGTLGPGARRSCHYECTIMERGRYRVAKNEVTSGFPFGLTTARKLNKDVPADLYVYPQLYELQPHWQRLIASRVDGLATTARRSGVSEGEFYGIRGWQHGDSRRWIHWRTTARLNELAVRQFQQQRRHEICLVVDASGSGVAGKPNAGRRNKAAALDATFAEQAIRMAATIVMRLGKQPANRLVVAIVGQQTTVHHLAGQATAVREAMRALAAVQIADPQPLSAAIELARRTTGGAEPVIVVSPHAADAGRLASPEGSVALGQADVRWLDMRSPLAQQLIVPGSRSETGFDDAAA